MDILTAHFAGPIAPDNATQEADEARILRTVAPRALPTLLLLIALVKLATLSFIPGWQPMASPLPHPILAAADGVALLAFSIIAITGRGVGAWGLALLLTAWIAGLQGPGIIASPASVALWLGVGEVGAVVAASALIAAWLDVSQHWKAWRTGACAAFGLCCCVFGVSHFVYADFTAQMIPSWFPMRLALAYLTGSAHIAAGIAIASGYWRQTAAMLLTVMMGCFVLFVHIPAVVLSSASLLQCQFILNASALFAAALVIWWASTNSAESARPIKGRRPF